MDLATDIGAQVLIIVLILMAYLMYRVKGDFINALKLSFFRGTARKLYIVRPDTGITEIVLVDKKKFTWKKQEGGITPTTNLKTPDFTVAKNDEVIQETVGVMDNEGKILLDKPRFRVKHTGIPAHILVQGLPTDVGKREIFRELTPEELSVDISQRVHTAMKEHGEIERIKALTSLFDRIKNDPRIFWFALGAMIVGIVCAGLLFQQGQTIQAIANKVGVDMNGANSGFKLF